MVIESIYSVLGDAADIARTAAICAEHDALLIVDEAHGIGVAGAGRGAVYAAGLAGAEHVVITATLSKALGAQGGAVLGPALLREHLVSTARTFLFDTALAPAAAAAAAAACRIIAAEPQRVAALHEVARRIAIAAGIEPRSRCRPVHPGRLARRCPGHRTTALRPRHPRRLLPAANRARRHLPTPPDRAGHRGRRPGRRGSGPGPQVHERTATRRASPAIVRRDAP